MQGNEALDDVAAQWLKGHMSLPTTMTLLQNCVRQHHFSSVQYTGTSLWEMLTSGIAAGKVLQTLLHYLQELKLGLQLSAAPPDALKGVTPYVPVVLSRGTHGWLQDGSVCH